MKRICQLFLHNLLVHRQRRMRSDRGKKIIEVESNIVTQSMWSLKCFGRIDILLLRSNNERKRENQIKWTISPLKCAWAMNKWKKTWGWCNFSLRKSNSHTHWVEWNSRIYMTLWMFYVMLIITIIINSVIAVCLLTKHQKRSKDISAQQHFKRRSKEEK